MSKNDMNYNKLFRELQRHRVISYNVIRNPFDVEKEISTIEYIATDEHIQSITFTHDRVVLNEYMTQFKLEKL
jgi:hypothetical protein